MKRVILVVSAVAVMASLKSADRGQKTSLEPRPLVDTTELVGTWRELNSTQSRGFSADGSTWIHGPENLTTAAQRRQGSWRFLTERRIEIQMSGEAPGEWTVDFNNDVLRMSPPGGKPIGYLNASSAPAYAPFSATSKDEMPRH